jgi:hypothetical protein
MPKDEFELLLERCHERLAGINLNVPTLDGGAPRQTQTAYSLTPAAPAPQKPSEAPKPSVPAALVAPPEVPEPPKPAAPPALAARPVVAEAPLPAAKPPLPRPAAEEREEDEFFPPLRISPRTSAPSAPLWRAPSAPAPAPAPTPAPARGRRVAAVSAASALAAAGAFGVWLARRPAADLSIKVDGADAFAIRPDKGDLLVAEGKDLVDLARDGRTLSRRPLDSAIDFMRWEQGSLWTTDGLTPSIIEHVEGGRTTVFRLNHVPGSIFVSDKYLWTAEKGGRTIHQFLISRSILGAILQPIDSFQLNGLTPDSFTIDDAGALWLAEESTRRLYRLRLENGAYKLIESAPLSPLIGPEGKLRGLTIEDDAVWIMARPAPGGRGALRRILLSRLDWTPA